MDRNDTTERRPRSGGPVLLAVLLLGLGSRAANANVVGSFEKENVNDALLDKIQTFPGAPPFEIATESETSMVSLGTDIVVGYNTSAGTNFVDAQGDVS